MRDKTDDELVELAGENSPYAELLRRNTEALKESSNSAHKYAVNTLVLTIFLFAITGATFILDLLPVAPDSKWFKLIIGILLVTGFIYMIGKEMASKKE